MRNVLRESIFSQENVMKRPQWTLYFSRTPPMLKFAGDAAVRAFLVSMSAVHQSAGPVGSFFAG